MNEYYKTLDRGENFNLQRVYQENLSIYQQGVETGIRNFEYYKNIMDIAMRSKDFSHVHYYALRIDSTPEFLCAGGIFPDYDFEGNSLQYISDTMNIADFITFSLLATETGGIIMFSWIGKGEKCMKLIQTLHSLSDEDIPDAILMFAFSYFSNIFISPIWWNKIDNKVKQRLNKIYETMTSVVTNGNHLKKANHIKAISWKILSRETNLT